ncbi:uncharacterized protein [Nicotiana sylvestris]|uniref:uncharacterized protein n=1 Tax=Nicotiana sylvestris TaxID=4096 RepID=UPI00388C68F2
MTNPQDNPGNSPPPTPYNSSTPPPPSTSPKPRLRRVKMLAQKIVASGAMRKKLNEKLKSSHAQNSGSNSNSESYKSATEGEGPGSSDSEKTQESPSKNYQGHEGVEVKRILKRKKREREGACERVEESGKKSGGSGFGEAAEELVNLSTYGDEPSSSTEETLADLLKMFGSYKKQSESDLQKALAESKKKKLAKGKGKVTESSEDVEVDKMEQAAEPSLAKRTWSAVKGKKVKISEDEEWSGEEVEDDSDGE